MAELIESGARSAAPHLTTRHHTSDSFYDGAVSTSPPNPATSPAVTTWTDYLCPWAYLGRVHTQWLLDQGVHITVLPYELHPDLPRLGRDIRPGGRYDRILDRIADECHARGVAFTKPKRTPNTRRVLETHAIIARTQPEQLLAFDEQCAHAAWVERAPIDDPTVLHGCLERAEVDLDAVERHSHAGDGARWLDAGRLQAIDHDVAGTPAWRLGSFTVTGMHPDEQFHKWCRRVLSLPD